MTLLNRSQPYDFEVKISDEAYMPLSFTEHVGAPPLGLVRDYGNIIMQRVKENSVKTTFKGYIVDAMDNTPVETATVRIYPGYYINASGDDLDAISPNLTLQVV